MRLTAMVLGCVFGFSLIGAAQAQTQTTEPVRTEPDGRWFISFGLGEGQIKISSDQQNGDRLSTFALGLTFGHRIGRRFRAGMEANGWLLQAFDLNNPAVGESLGNVMAMADFLPAGNHGLYVRGGVGHVSYSNNRPTGTYGGGLAWEAGAGYEIRLHGRLRLVPAVTYAAGRFGDDRYATIPLTNRRYNVVDFRLSALYYFGQ